MSFPDHINQIERRIINVVLSNIANLAHEYPNLEVRVSDEEELEYVGPADTDKIRGAIGHTDMTRVAVYLRDGKSSRASVLFIHGNYEDVLSDTSWSKGCEWLEQRLCKGTPADLGDEE